MGSPNSFWQNLTEVRLCAAWQPWPQSLGRVTQAWEPAVRGLPDGGAGTQPEVLPADSHHESRYTRESVGELGASRPPRLASVEAGGCRCMGNACARAQAAREVNMLPLTLLTGLSDLSCILLVQSHLALPHFLPKQFPSAWDDLCPPPPTTGPVS